MYVWGGGVCLEILLGKTEGLYLPQSACDIASTYGRTTGWGKCLEKVWRLRLGVGITTMLRGLLRTLQKIGCKKQPTVGCIVVRKKMFQCEGLGDMCFAPSSFRGPFKGVLHVACRVRTAHYTMNSVLSPPSLSHSSFLMRVRV